MDELLSHWVRGLVLETSLEEFYLLGPGLLSLSMESFLLAELLTLSTLSLAHYEALAKESVTNYYLAQLGSASCFAASHLTLMKLLQSKRLHHSLYHYFQSLSFISSPSWQKPTERLSTFQKPKANLLQDSGLNTLAYPSSCFSLQSIAQLFLDQQALLSYFSADHYHSEHFLTPHTQTSQEELSLEEKQLSFASCSYGHELHCREGALIHSGPLHEQSSYPGSSDLSL